MKNRKTKLQTDVTMGYEASMSDALVRRQRIPVGANILDLTEVPVEVAEKIIKLNPNMTDKLDKLYNINVNYVNSIPSDLSDIYLELVSNEEDKGLYSRLVKSLGYDAIKYPANQNVQNDFTNYEKPSDNILIINEDIVKPKRFERKKQTQSE